MSLASFRLGMLKNIQYICYSYCCSEPKEKMFRLVTITAPISHDQDKSETLSQTLQSLKQIWSKQLQQHHSAHCFVHTGYNVKTPVSKSSQRGSFSPNGSTTTGPPVYPTTGPSVLQPNVAKCHL